MRVRFTRLAAVQSWLRIRRGEIAIIFFLFLFVALTVIAKSPGLRLHDANISRFIQRIDTPILTTICEALTILGSGTGLILLSLPIFLVLWQAKKPIAAWFQISTVLGHVLNIGLKALVNRPRPGLTDQVTVIMAANGSSFPSGHAMTATLYFGFLAALVSIHISKRSRRQILLNLSITVGLGICFSRIYLGAHFLSDVIGGIAAGLLFLFLWIKAYEYFAPKEFPPIVSNDVPGDR